MKQTNRWTQVAIALCLSVGLISQSAHAEDARVIVKYREDSALLSQASELSRRTIMSAQTGLNITASRTISTRLQALQATGLSSAELVEQLASRSDVEYVVPDEHRSIQSVPNDTYYTTQWYLQTTEASAIKAQSAWDTTTGNSSVVVAVVDTGILPNHPDLQSNLIFSGGSVYGYDFIATTFIANDGDGRDADPSDPGDWVTSADVSAYPSLCTSTANSSWHGTMVAGIIAAATNNNIGVAGVARGIRILPIRALGKCGGYDSDIITAILWAAGISVSGVTDNSYPAKIINLSLGGSGTCSAAYTDAISQITAKGALIVAAAGNSATAPGVPANCSGVLAVGALDNTGAKTYYSDFGSAVGISAPGGNPNSSKTVCSYPFVSTTNDSTTSPNTSGYTYSTVANGFCSMGTSFSTPLVVGTAALMASVNSSLTPSQLISLLKSSATAFPTVSGLNSCASTTSGATVSCNCTTTTCGAGMLNAATAVAAAQVATSSSSSSSSSGSSSGSSGAGPASTTGSSETGGGGAASVLDILLILLLGALGFLARHRQR
jgi:serine protease